MKVTAIIATAAIATAVLCTGCSQVYSWFGTSKEEVHVYAMDKAFDLLDKAVAKQLDDYLEKKVITQQEYEVLIKRAAEGEKELRKLLDEIYAKYKVKKSTTTDKETTPTKVQEGTVETAAASLKKGKKVSKMMPKVEKQTK